MSSKKTNRSIRKKTSRSTFKSKRRRKTQKNSASWIWRIIKFLLKYGLIAALIIAPFLFLYTLTLDGEVRTKFEGARWAIPSKVYAQPMTLFPGKQIKQKVIKAELLRLGYAHKQAPPLSTGQFMDIKGGIIVYQRKSQHFDRIEDAQLLKLKFKGNVISSIVDDSAQDVSLVTLDAPLIGSFYANQGEDRILVNINDVPPLLVNTLLAVEDRAFYDHVGVNPKGILRAVVMYVLYGKKQGGSTLTQQLVKNFFLTNERTFKRKFNEALMAFILEYHYEKDEILEAYLNEIYLGQQGDKAIHGFGLASQFYFNKPLNELSEEQIALLVGLAKGASYYSPHRNPERAKSRRDVVIGVMASQKVIPQDKQIELVARPLGLKEGKLSNNNARYPAFFEWVKQQLSENYSAEDLRSEGLKVFTTMNINIQNRLENSAKEKLLAFEKARGLKENTLQTAGIVTAAESGEVLALIGDRKAGFSGFNRALKAKRQIGSLVKPFVYLTALESKRYSLATPLDDSPLEMRQADDTIWKPQNYDKQNHGNPFLIRSIANSFNLSTIRLGLDVGLDNIAKSLEKAGHFQVNQLNPSLLLGAIELSPVEVTQAYQTIAANGFYTPLKTIKAVVDKDGQQLTRYPIQIKQAYSDGSIFLIRRALQEVTLSGTSVFARNSLPKGTNVMGKTGTTDNLRDSWFAGFTNDYLGVVWVGRDDNKPSKLTGASGALRVWTDVFKGLNHPTADLPAPENVVDYLIDVNTGFLVDPATNCAERTVRLPFVRGTEPQQVLACNEAIPAKNPVELWGDTISEMFSH